MEIVSYKKEWPDLFEAERDAISKITNDEIIDIQHIGSTAIPGLAAKPIIDIVILIPSIEEAQVYFKSLEKIRYKYQPEQSSAERFFFTKNTTPAFHLSLAQPDKYSFWRRQKLFRDYLISHPEAAKDYEDLKKQLIKKYPDGRQEYTDGKSSFIDRVLELAEAENSLS